MAIMSANEAKNSVSEEDATIKEITKSAETMFATNELNSVSRGNAIQDKCILPANGMCANEVKNSVLEEHATTEQHIKSVETIIFATETQRFAGMDDVTATQYGQFVVDVSTKKSCISVMVALYTVERTMVTADLQSIAQVITDATMENCMETNHTNQITTDNI